MADLHQIRALGDRSYQAQGEAGVGKSRASICVVVKDFDDPPPGAFFHLRHPCIPEFYRFDGGVVYEFIRGERLESLNLPPRQVIAVHASVASALAYLHSSGFCHGRVCPEHIIVDKSRTVLVGFGHPQDRQQDFADLGNSIILKVADPGIGLSSLCDSLAAGKHSDMGKVEKELAYYANRARVS